MSEATWDDEGIKTVGMGQRSVYRGLHVVMRPSSSCQSTWRGRKAFMQRTGGGMHCHGV